MVELVYNYVCDFLLASEAHSLRNKRFIALNQLDVFYGAIIT